MAPPRAERRRRPPAPPRDHARRSARRRRRRPPRPTARMPRPGRRSPPAPVGRQLPGHGQADPAPPPVSSAARADPSSPATSTRRRRRRRLVAQLPAQDLAGDRLRDLVDDLDLPGILVRRHPLLAESDELLGFGAPSGLEADEGLDRLPTVGIRN